jgi:TM2 domain-containing membrane protein YozV
MKFFSTFFLILFLINTCVLAGDKEDNIEQQGKLELLSQLNNTPAPSKLVDLNSRKFRAIVFSTFVPGSGQTFLGNQLKGIGFTLGFYGTVVTAVLAHANMVSREERIEVLTKEYRAAGNFPTAERVWQRIEFERGNRDNDHDRRQIFTIAAAGVWVLNMIDIIFLSSDAGLDEFAAIPQNKNFNINFAADDDYSGIEFKLNLP